MPVANSSARFLFDILALLGPARHPMTLTEVRQALDLPAATAHRGLATLEQAGFVERFQASTRYQLGPRARLLRQAFFARFVERDRVLPFLRRLSAATGQTTCFSIRLGWFTARVAAITGPGSLVYSGPVGAVARLDDDVGGHAILASLPPPERAAFAAYAAAHGRSSPSTVAGPGITLVLQDRLGRPAAVAFVDGQAEPGPGERGPWSAILDQLAAELSPFDHHYSHLTLTTPDLLNQLERARAGSFPRSRRLGD